MKPQTDIAVIGAGPCGSFAALTAAKLGANVTVFEEHEEIGVPTHCSGHLSLSGLKRLGLHLPRNIIKNEFRGATFYSPLGNEFSIIFDSPVTCVVDRELFDKYLAEHAMKAGVEYRLKSRVKSLVTEKGFVKGVTVVCGGRNEETVSKLVIDAEGTSSILLKQAGMKPLNSRMLVNAVQAEVDRIDDVGMDCVEVYLGRKFASGFFVWVIPKKDGSAKVGLATNQGNPKLCLQNFIHKNPIASQKLKNSRIKSVFYHPITLGGPILKTFANALLIVGDAASQVKPTTGGGVVTGLLCAKIAGEVAYEALQNGDFSENFLVKYEKEWRKEIDLHMKTMLRLRKMFNRLTDRKIDKIIRLCKGLGVDNSLAKVEDVDFLDKSLLKLGKNPSILVVATYFLLSSLTSPCTT